MFTTLFSLLIPLSLPRKSLNPKLTPYKTYSSQSPQQSTPSLKEMAETKFNSSFVPARPNGLNTNSLMTKLKLIIAPLSSPAKNHIYLVKRKNVTVFFTNGRILSQPTPREANAFLTSKMKIKRL